MKKEAGSERPNHKVVRNIRSPNQNAATAGGGGGEGLARPGTVISRQPGNSVLQTDNSVFKRHDHILSGLLLGNLREREHNQWIYYREVVDLWYTSAEKRSHSLSSVFATCFWNTRKSTLSRVLSPRLDGNWLSMACGRSRHPGATCTCTYRRGGGSQTRWRVIHRKRSGGRSYSQL